MKRNNISKCRTLRKNQTDAEKKLWSATRDRQLAGIKFRRQFSVNNFIIDFYAPEHRLGLEVDGGQHYENRSQEYDKTRTEELEKLGIKILRFTNLEILKNLRGVCEKILETADRQTPHLNPLPTGERRPKSRSISVTVM
jgi:very-short-patch-repair endonuclease